MSGNDVNDEHSVVIDLIEADCKNELVIEMNHCHSEFSWNEIISKIGKELKDGNWRSNYALQSAEGVNIENVADLADLFESLDDNDDKEVFLFIKV